MGKVVAFVGMAGSGKGTCTGYLAELGFDLIHFGQMIVEETESRGLAVNEKNERTVREDMRKTHGKDVFAKRVAARAQEYIENGSEVIILDGLYSWTEQKVLREMFKDQLILVAVFTPKAVRYARLAEREYRPCTHEEATSRDIAEIENSEKGGPIAYADYLMHNTDTPEHLKAEIDTLLKKLDISYPS